MNTRELILAVAGGVASAAVGRVIGRAVHLALPVPMSGSIVAALPRAVILLVVLSRVRRFGALTTAGLAEAAVALGFGGTFPFALLAPVAAGVVADGVWVATGPLSSDHLRLGLAGATWCAARVLTVLFLLILVRVPLPRVPGGAQVLLWGIVGANAVLGVAAGLVATSIVKELRRAGVME